MTHGKRDEILPGPKMGELLPDGREVSAWRRGDLHTSPARRGGLCLNETAIGKPTGYPQSSIDGVSLTTNQLLGVAPWGKPQHHHLA